MASPTLAVLRQQTKDLLQVTTTRIFTDAQLNTLVNDATHIAAKIIQAVDKGPWTQFNGQTTDIIPIDCREILWLRNVRTGVILNKYFVSGGSGNIGYYNVGNKNSAVICYVRKVTDMVADADSCDVPADEADAIPFIAKVLADTRQGKPPDMGALAAASFSLRAGTEALMNALGVSVANR